MKAYALIAALALAVPAPSFAGKKHVVVVSGGCGPSFGHYHSGYRSYGGYGGGYYRSYPSYSRSYCYTSPSYYSYPAYSYYAPSVSFGYTSAPRTVYRTPVDYSDAPSAASSSSMEADVQRALKRRGYYDGSVDGDIGPASRSAIRAFQYERGLRATGRIDSALLDALGL